METEVHSVHSECLHHNLNIIWDFNEYAIYIWKEQHITINSTMSNFRRKCGFECCSVWSLTLICLRSRCHGDPTGTLTQGKNLNFTIETAIFWQTVGPMVKTKAIVGEKRLCLTSWCFFFLTSTNFPTFWCNICWKLWLGKWVKDS